MKTMNRIVLCAILALAGFTYADSLNVSLAGHICGGACRVTFTVGDYCYIGEGDWFSVMDVSDPTDPTLIGHCYTPGVILDINVSGSYAYVADGEDGLRIIDVSDPTSPTETGFYNTPGYAYGVDVSGSYAYVADGGDGLYILDVSHFTGIEENGNKGLKPLAYEISAYPNPFNSAITIVFDYGSESRSGEQVGCGPAAGGVGASDARSGQVGIEIFDISGRLVADLPVTTCDESQVVPTPRIWQPDESLGSGIYLVRARFDKLSDREKQITKRVVYLK